LIPKPTKAAEQMQSKRCAPQQSYVQRTAAVGTDMQTYMFVGWV